MSQNVCEVEYTDGRRVCFSYGVPVAAFIPRDYAMVAEMLTGIGCPDGYLRTDARYSVTTSKHMNQFAGRDSLTVPDAVFRTLIGPVSKAK